MVYIKIRDLKVRLEWVCLPLESCAGMRWKCHAARPPKPTTKPVSWNNGTCTDEDNKTHKYTNILGIARGRTELLSAQKDPLTFAIARPFPALSHALSSSSYADQQRNAYCQYFGKTQLPALMYLTRTFHSPSSVSNFTICPSVHHEPFSFFFKV